MATAAASLSRGISMDSNPNNNSSPPRRSRTATRRSTSAMRSPSPSTERFLSVATPTFDNRNRSTSNTSGAGHRRNISNNSLTPKSSPKSNRKTTERPSTDRKTKIQVCVRVRPILPSDSKRSSSTGTNNFNVNGSSSKHSLLPPTPEEKMKNKVKIKARTPKRDLLHKDTSRLSSMSSPSSSSDISDDTDPAWTVINNEISQSEHTNPDSNRNNKYRFDHSFGPEDDNQDIYENSVRDSVISAMEGYHASVFAYGQTATGKTFTMTGGGSHIAHGREGVIQMAIRDCFEYIHSQKSETREYLLRVSFMEIYNEVINDLLASPQRSQPHMTTSTTSLLQNPAAPQASAIRIFESKNEGVIVRGLKEEIVTCPEQVFALLAAGERRRQTGSTAMNKQSSRSHSIFRLIIESRKRIPRGSTPSPSPTKQNDAENDSIASSTFAPASTSGPVRVSTLSLVDLAGSESVKNTGSTGTRQKEGTYINKSLLTLGHVVYKLAEISMKKDKEGDGNGNGSGMVDTTHIPYRDSKLTRLLQPSLSGNAQICIICNISPLARHIEESHLTLKFASRAKKIKQHATITEVVDEKTLLENYREEIEELKNQLKEAKYNSQDSSNSQTLNTSSIDDDDVQVLSQAVSNLERLILKTTTADEKKRKQKRREAMARIQVEQGIPANISGGSGSKSSGGNTLLNGLFNKEEQEDENTLLNSLSLDDYSQKMDSKATTSSFKDDQSLGSLGDESTVVEGKKLVNELHRIQGLLATVLKKKGSTVTPSANISVSTPIMGPPMIRKAESEVEVERLRAQLHEQAVHSSLRMADSTFLQAQLQEKDALLKDISQILEAVEKRQVELETENDRLKLQWHNGMSELRGKESETIILEKLIKKRDDQIKGFKAQLAGDDDESEGE